MGAAVTEGEGMWIIQGIGRQAGGDRNTPLVIDVGNSGTTLYLGLAAAASLGRPVVFTGDAQIRQRPVTALISAYEDLGAQCATDLPADMRDTLNLEPPLKEGSVPCIITGPLTGGHTSISCPTSQYLSSLLLAAPLAQGPCTIDVPLLYEQPYAELTVGWLREQEISFTRDGYRRFHIPGGQQYKPYDKEIPGDYSSASFFFCAAAVTGSTLTVTSLSCEDPQGDRQILACLQSMGCEVTWRDSRSVTVTGPPKGMLQAGAFNLNAMPDTLPVLSVTACFARGTTRLFEVPQARIKETDRIAVMCSELRKLGAIVEELEDGLVIEGTGELSGGSACGHGDHRVIMALAVAALGSRHGVTIDDTCAAEITFPGFFTILEQIRTN